MCYRCHLYPSLVDAIGSQQAHGLGEPHTAVDQRLGGIAEPALDLIAPELLISETFTRFSKTHIAHDGVITLSLHTQGGPALIGGGGYGEQTIQSRVIHSDLIQVIERQIQRVDAVVDLDFVISSNGTKGDIDFYVDSEIETGSTTEVTLGIALANHNATRGGWWELLLNGPPLEADRDYMHYASLHELGHSLGLEHPFDTGDGDVYQSNNPNLSAYAEQTVMAYREPLSGGDWPSTFSTSDLEALITIWGPESQTLSNNNDVFNGEAYSEKVNGSRGEDRISGGGGNDILFGGRGNDWINGNHGNDELFGNLGHDHLYGGKGDDVIWGNDGTDLLFGNLGDDVLNGGLGDDQLSGGEGADRFVLSGGEDRVADFSSAQGDRIQLVQGISYQAQVAGQTLKIQTAEGVLSLANASQHVSDIHQWIDFA